MKIGFAGLGKMGSRMVERLLRGGHEVVACDRDPGAVAAAEKAGAIPAGTLPEMVRRLAPPRAVWVMVPAGEPTGTVIRELGALLEAGDTVVDGGNSNYRETMVRADSLQKKGIALLDCGTSGGIWGLKEGYCLMAGGDEEAFGRLEPVLKTLAPPGGYARMGPSGSGHFVKMIHNGIEYGLLQAYGEGFEILRAKREFDLDLGAISRLWNRGSVVRSWLLELAERAFAADPGLDSVRGYVEDSGEGRWSVAEALALDVPAPVITLSLLARLNSRQEESFSARTIAALRNQFGGHAVKGAPARKKPAAAVGGEECAAGS